MLLYNLYCRSLHVQQCILFIINQSTQTHSNTLFSSVFTKVHNITWTIWCLDCSSRINTLYRRPVICFNVITQIQFSTMTSVACILLHTWWCITRLCKDRYLPKDSTARICSTYCWLCRMPFFFSSFALTWHCHYCSLFYVCN